MRDKLFRVFIFFALTVDLFLLGALVLGAILNVLPVTEKMGIGYTLFLWMPVSAMMVIKYFHIVCHRFIMIPILIIFAVGVALLIGTSNGIYL